ncbi:MAG: protein-disulfide reductase DsbD family protein [Stagnimonas sp.]|nr:protein-disulfide reductase DsbD family protein [Stagnimonas sp.]
MIRSLILLPLLTTLALLPAAASAAAPPSSRASTPHVEAELLTETTALLRGGDSTVALKLVPEQGWHTYWINAGDSGLPTRLLWTLPDGVGAGAIQWPAPHRASLGELTNYGYDDETLHLVSIAVPADWPLNQPLKLQAKAKWLVCKDVCIPGEAELSLSRPVTDGAADLDPAVAPTFEQARAELPQPLPEGASARFAIAGGQFSMALEGADFSQAQAIDFFPYDGALVNHAAPQKLAVASGGLRLTQALSGYFLEAPTEVGGVLVVEHGKQREAYEIKAAPGSVTPVTGESARPAAASPDAVAPAGTVGLASALLLALLGGLILNLMPCVFPVLSLKALSLAQSAERGRGEQRRQALAYSAGTVLSCVAVAGLLLALRAGGEALGWGFQLQSPLFIAALAYLMLALGLAMSGLLEIGTSWMGVGSSLADRPGLAGSFFTGVLAVVVASPCTAPFMGSALGYAVTQPLAVALAVFAALGLGLALPFLLIGFVPALARQLPKPGLWMLTFKQAMAFPLYLTVAWLLWVLTRQAGADALGLIACGLVAVALAVWLLGRPGRGRVSVAIALLSLASAAYLLTTPALRTPTTPAGSAQRAEHAAWSAEKVRALRAEGRSVFVDFTADWCITCKVNERGALASDTVREAFEREQVAVLVADWTSADPAITKGLAEFGRNGVPLYLVYPKGGEPRVLPQVLTPQIVVDALKR